ncbi:MAG: glutamyl-tRNA reductase [Planctomycetota bacterium]|jgi:glutamyl-tRNA reductase
MNIIVTGLNHKSAPIDIRERLAFNAAGTTEALRQLKKKFPDTEFALLSTCNRVELYSASATSMDAGGFDSETMVKFFSDFHDLAPKDFMEFLYVHKDADAVKHLLTVVSSLDSMVVGESQIVSQVKESYSLACTTKSTGKILNRLFHNGFATSKKVHTTTSISSGRVSVAGVAVELSMQLFDDVSAAKVVVLGAGEMSELLVQHFLHIDCKDITVVNRSYERGLELADRYSIRSQKWDQLDEQLIAADIVVAATGAPDYLFDKKSFSQIAEKRRGALLVIDIAVPRNFAPDINQLDEVYLYSVDDLSEVVEQNRKAREDDIAKGMRIVEKNVADFMDWFRSRDIGPLIGQMRAEFAQISQKEMDRFFVGVRDDASCKQAAESMVNRIVNRLLHCVIKNVDEVAQKHGPAEAAKFVDSIVRQAEEISAGLDNNNNEDGKS